MTRTTELMNQANGSEPPPRGGTVSDLMAKMKGEFAKALPSYITPDRFVRVAMTEIRKNPKLGSCSSISLIGAMMEAAQDGFEFGDGRCHLIPRWSKKIGGYEACYQRGYQGVLELARRSGEYAEIGARVVHENDEFDFEEGSNAYLRFKRSLGDRGKVLAYYAMSRIKGGDMTFTVMSVPEITAHRDRYASTKNKAGEIYGTWIDDFDSMALKTVLVKHLKYQPKSRIIMHMIETDDRVIEYDEKAQIATSKSTLPEIEAPGEPQEQQPQQTVYEEPAESLPDEPPQFADEWEYQPQP